VQTWEERANVAIVTLAAERRSSPAQDFLMLRAMNAMFSTLSCGMAAVRSSPDR
jgi:hypothetical protein